MLKNMPNTRDIFLVFVSLVLGFCSCSKSPFSNGFEREETRSVHGYFKVLEMNDDVDVTLIRNVTPRTSWKASPQTSTATR